MPTDADSFASDWQQLVSGIDLVEQQVRMIHTAVIMGTLHFGPLTEDAEQILFDLYTHIQETWADSEAFQEIVLDNAKPVITHTQETQP